MAPVTPLRAIPTSLYLVCFAVAGCLGCLAATTAHLGYDEEMYTLLARGLFDSVFEVYPGSYGGYGPVGHYLFGLNQLAFGPSILVGRFLSVILWLCSLLLLTIRPLPNSRFAGYGFAALLAASVSPWFIEMSARSAYYGLSALVLAALFFLLGRLDQHPWNGVLFGFLLALLPFVRDSSLFFSVGFLVAAAWDIRRTPRRLVLVGASAIGSAGLLALMFPEFALQIVVRHVDIALPMIPIDAHHSAKIVPGVPIDSELVVVRDRANQMLAFRGYLREHTIILVVWLTANLLRGAQLWFGRLRPRSLDLLQLLFGFASIFVFVWLPTAKYGLFSPQYLAYAYPVFLIGIFVSTGDPRLSPTVRIASATLICATLVVVFVLDAPYKRANVLRTLVRFGSHAGAAGAAHPASEHGMLSATGRAVEAIVPRHSRVWTVGYAYILAERPYRTRFQVMNQYHSFRSGPEKEPAVRQTEATGGAFDRHMLRRWLSDYFDYVLVPDIYLDRWWNPSRFRAPIVRATAAAYRDVLNEQLSKNYHLVAVVRGWEAWDETSISIYKRSRKVSR